MNPKSRMTALSTVELLALELEDVLGTVRSLHDQVEYLTLSERQWIEYLEETIVQWHHRLNRVDMFQPYLWDGHH